MGNYATTTDLKDRFEDIAAVAHLTDTSDTGTPDEDVLNEVIDHAEMQIDGSCAVRYLIPIQVSGNAGLTAFMKSLTLDIAQFHLYGRHHTVTESITLFHDKAMEWLEKVTKGEVLLPSPDTEASTTSRDPLISFTTTDVGSDSDRIYSRKTQGAL